MRKNIVVFLRNAYVTSSQARAIFDPEPGPSIFAITSTLVKITENFIPISKWNLKFTGESECMGSNVSLERAKELAVARGVDESLWFGLVEKH